MTTGSVRRERPSGASPRTRPFDPHDDHEGLPTDELRSHPGPRRCPSGRPPNTCEVKLRPDLVVQPQFYEGMTHYVIKDPLALKYFRFKIEEYFLLQQFDGKQTLQDVKKAFERKYRPADDLDRGPDPVRRPAPRGGHRPDRQPRAGQGPDPPPQEEPLAEGLGSSSPTSSTSRSRSSTPSGC